ncbi:4a-hydroxytetrahydrobiopterin dehydratase [archaeon]|nr:4a-hydroxytetrahydrobiopterin dehydratase [archaeon]
MAGELLKMNCVPCEKGTPPLNSERVEALLYQVAGWKLNSQGWLVREYKFKDFAKAIEFVNKVAELAEKEEHHPNIYVYSWNRLRLELYTHSIGGLSENDFVLAAKVNGLKA